METKTKAKMQSLIDQLAPIADLVRRLKDSSFQNHIFGATEARSYEVIFFDNKDITMDLTLYVEPIVDAGEESELTPNDF